MLVDQITLNDLAIFHPEEEYSIFHRLNFTQTNIGKEWLRHFFSEPLSDIEKILGTQRILRTLMARAAEWPKDISNGTMHVIDRFFDYQLGFISSSHNKVSALTYRLFNSGDYSMIRYSVMHFADFYRGLKVLLGLLQHTELPRQLAAHLERIDSLLREKPLAELAALDPKQKLSIKENLYFAYYLRGAYKSRTFELIDIFGRLEAWHSMALAMQRFGLQFPEFVAGTQPQLHSKGLYHVLLRQPVAYDLLMDPTQNFVFLTGANMAGKSTLIKATGAAVYLAHLGMGVPAAQMRLTLFDGLLSNINVTDNIVKGESYFYNEVQRIKNTIVKINDGGKWLVLIDELFKGTNMQDAMKCSLTVIKGLVKMHNSLFILSTHLYEIGEELRVYPNIAFKYFETTVENDQLSFSYQLREGISNDRIGYVILRREKVVDLLESLGGNV
ncbi:MAG: DNA mismatch repair protein MutS [Chitinophagaceae bacterium]|nr:MAG: DNA mismatch repair protein MutS [Chitinophagaceae bacterium]